MKNFLLLLTMICCWQIQTTAQNADATVYETIYRNATQQGDLTSAAFALHHLIATTQDSARQQLYKESLVQTYFNQQNYWACERLASQLIAQAPVKLPILEMRATSRRQLGAAKEAISDYKLLLNNTNNAFHAYYLAQLQLGQQALDDGLVTLKKAEQLGTQEEDWVQLPVNQQQVQAVPLRAAIYHLKGITLQSLNTKENKTEALAAYEEAIRLFPDFYLAKQQKEALADMD